VIKGNTEPSDADKDGGADGGRRCLDAPTNGLQAPWPAEVWGHWSSFFTLGAYAIDVDHCVRSSLTDDIVTNERIISQGSVTKTAQARDVRSLEMTATTGGFVGNMWARRADQ
jgi:hypothetical protein